MSGRNRSEAATGGVKEQWDGRGGKGSTCKLPGVVRGRNRVKDCRRPEWIDLNYRKENASKKGGCGQKSQPCEV